MPADFLFTNALQIPSIFSEPFDTTFRISFLIFSVMLIVAILHENIQALKGESDFIGLFMRTILILSLLLIYERVFIWVVYGMDLLAKAIMPEEEFKQVVQAVFREVKDKKDFGLLKFFSIMTVLNFITYSVALALLGVMNWLRFVFLSLLFVLGPILAGFGIYKSTSQGLQFWIKSLISVSLWVVVFAILMKVIATMNLTSIYLPQETNSASVFAANILFILLFISVPLISHQITSSGSLSGLGSAVIGLGTAFVTKNLISHRPNKYNAKPNTTHSQGGYK